jgi:hypothetical protein
MLTSCSIFKNLCIMYTIENSQLKGNCISLYYFYITSSFRVGIVLSAWLTPQHLTGHSQHSKFVRVLFWQHLGIGKNIFQIGIVIGLVVRLPGCRPRGSRFDSRRCQIFWVGLSLEQGPHSPFEDKWGATWKKSSNSSLENYIKIVCHFWSGIPPPL